MAKPEVDFPPAPAPSTVLVVHGDEFRGGAIAAELRRLRGDVRATTVPPTDQARVLVPHDADVVIVGLGVTPATLPFVMAVLLEQPWMHAVFVAPAKPCPETEALRCIGAHYVFAEAQLLGWLAGALPALSGHSRARRCLAEAERALPAFPPSLEPALADPDLPLPQAEQRFRESYLRLVLSRAQSQKGAARLAGIPYSTLRSMVEKLLL
jgi:hypothetical protein